MRTGVRVECQDSKLEDVLFIGQLEKELQDLLIDCLGPVVAIPFILLLP